MEIEDQSKDKKYFTIIPNYILNHSTATDQALYLQMKRIAGEYGKCKASEKYFCRQLKIGREKLKKSLEYLITHKWISYKGKEKINTQGGVQDVNTYLVNDIWKTNIEYYDKGVSKQALPETEGVSRIKPRGVQNGVQGVSKTDNKEELLKNNIKKNNFSSYKVKKKPYYDGKEMRKKNGAWYVLPGDDGSWLEFAAKEADIEWK